MNKIVSQQGDKTFSMESEWIPIKPRFGRRELDVSPEPSETLPQNSV